MDGEELTLEQSKVEAVFLHFDDVLGTPPPCRSNAINLDLLNLPTIHQSGSAGSNQGIAMR
jgi:hypothetical protein